MRKTELAASRTFWSFLKYLWFLGHHFRWRDTWPWMVMVKLGSFLIWIMSSLLSTQKFWYVDLKIACHKYIFSKLRFFGSVCFLVSLYILIMQLNAGNQKLTDVQRPSVIIKILNYTELHMATGMLCKYWHILVCFLGFYDPLNIFLCIQYLFTT